MKKLLLFAFIIVASMQLTAQQMLVGSYNIRYKNWNDSVQGEHWQKRCQVICDQVNFMSPDIFGTQEVLWEQLRHRARRRRARRRARGHLLQERQTPTPQPRRLLAERNARKTWLGLGRGLHTHLHLGQVQRKGSRLEPTQRLV